MPFMLINSVVLNAVLAARRLRRSGLIVDRQYTLNSTAASGRNFIAVSVLLSGGLGVAIGLLLSWCVAMKAWMKVLMMFFKILLDGGVFKKPTVNCQLLTDGGTRIDIKPVSRMN